mgnify:CR=1 FL=1
MGNWRIGNIKVEEMVETDPEVYRRRAYDALCVGQYRTAIQETEKALKYSNNDIQDYVEIARILVEMQEYRQCLEFIRQHKIVDYFFTEEYRKSGIRSALPQFFKIYLKCWKQVGGNLDEADVIIAVSDGTGMVESLQDAIDMESRCHRIYFRNMDRDGVLGIIEKKDLCIIMDDQTLGKTRTGKTFSKVIINSGNVRFINSDFSLTEYSVGVEINGGNVLFENTIFRNIYRRDLAIGVYVKNQALVSIKNCLNDYDSYGEIVMLYAECGEINMSHCIHYGTIAVIGKKGKCSLNMLSCGGQRVLVGYNTDSQITDCGCTYITLEGKLQMDCQDNLVMNVNDTRACGGCIAAYNGGTMYLHNVGIKDNLGGRCDLEADNGKIFCENFLNNGYTVEIRQGMGKNTEIVCDFKYKIVNKLRNELRMGAFLNKINWLTEN